MSGGGDKGKGDDRKSLLGEFSAAHMKEYEILSDRDFKQTTNSQIKMSDDRTHEINNVKQVYEAERDSIGGKAELHPSNDLNAGALGSPKDKYTDIRKRYEIGLEQIDVKYINIQDQIRESGVTLIDEFSENNMPPEIEANEVDLDLEQIGIDTLYEFNISADADYYGVSVGYDYDNGADPFSEDYGSHYEGDFIAPGPSKDQGRSR